MKNRYPILLFISVIIFYGCSPQSSDLIPQESPIVSPTSRTNQISLTTQPASPAHKVDGIETLVHSDQIYSTAIPVLIDYSIAGLEIKNEDDIKLADQAGMNWIRRNGLLWHLVEPVKGDREWAAVKSLEAELIAASSLGLNTILVVRGTPDWAQKVPGYYCGPVREDQLNSMGDFLYDAVLRYSRAPYDVKYWELGNEPDVNVLGSKPDMQYGCWGADSDVYFGGDYYAEMLKVVYPRIKSADPQAQVLIGGLLLDCDPVKPPEVPAGSGQIKDCKPATFLEGVLKNGGGEYFDGVAFHAYDYYYGIDGQYGNINWHSSWDLTGPVLAAKTKYIRNLLELHGYKDKFLMNTEGAILCGRDGKEPDCNTELYNRTKASYLVQVYTTSKALGLRANIWYSLHGWRGSGLLDQEGNQLSAYDALIFNTSILSDTYFHAKIREYDGLNGFSFENQESIIWVIWSVEGSVISIRPDDPPDRLYDYLGSDLTRNAEIPIGSSPIYLIWDKHLD
jgi:hypothetical protein